MHLAVHAKANVSAEIIGMCFHSDFAAIKLPVFN